MRRLAWLFIVVICLTCFQGCRSYPGNNHPETVPTQNLTNPVDTAEPTTAVSVETTKLAVLPWDCGRANETSGNILWEVEQGYYLEYGYMLYYADKSDLSQWIPVCTKADCEHDKSSHTVSACDANVASSVLLVGDRIYFDSNTKKIDDLKNTGLYSTFIGSMALDGSDKQVEYYIPEAEDAFKQGEMYMERSYLLTDCLVYSTAVLNREGTYEIVVYFVDDEGTDILFETTRENNALGGRLSRSSNLYGDEGFFEYVLEENSNILYRVRDRQLYGTDLTDISWNGGYLEGDTLKVFRSGDGYYQLDLRTGQETRLANAQMEHSFCHIMAPNCILESTVLNVAYLRDEVLETRQLHPVEEHTMRFFDGELWLDVALPEEVQKAQGGESLTPIALTSDRILFSFKDISDVMNEDPVALYQILLNTETPTLEYLGTIG